MTSKHEQGAPGIGGAARVAAGIFSSRVFGLVRESMVAFFLGVGPHADALRGAFRAPNLIQNLLGEQTLSAAFIPIYSRLIGEGRRQDAGRFAGAVFGLLLASACAVALAGVVFARPLVSVLTPGWLGDAARVAAGELVIDRFEFAVTGVRILFPATAFLVLGAWTLGVLNSHRRFFLPYFAPVLWNVSIIAALLFAGQRLFGVSDASGGSTVAVQSRVVLAAFWGGLVGGLLQFLVQLPLALRSLSGFRVSLSRSVVGVREALRNIVPVMAARGAAQLSSYLDIFLASWLIEGAVSGLGNAQVLYLLPISLFALSIAAAELPELSRSGQDPAHGEHRLATATRRISFFVIPTQLGYLAFGFLIVGALYRRGQFQLADNWLVYFILCAYAVGLLATAWSRMLTNVFYASSDTRTPAAIAVVRIGMSVVLGCGLMIVLDRLDVNTVLGEFGAASATGIKGDVLRLGAVGLAAGSALAAWFEWLRLRSRLRRRGWSANWPTAFVFGCYARALAAAAVGAGAWFACRTWHPVPLGALVVSIYALCYLGLARLQKVPEVADITSLLSRRPGS